jgi:hypothetical protein
MERTMNEHTVAKIEVSEILLLEEVQSRVDLDVEAIDEFAEKIKHRVEFPPIVVFQGDDGCICADGFHRVHAALKAKVEKLTAEIRDGGKREAILHSVGANATHGVRRTNADKRRAVAMLLGDPEWRELSARKIAGIASVTHPFVTKMKKALAGNGYQLELPLETADGQQVGATNAEGRTRNGRRCLRMGRLTTAQLPPPRSSRNLRVPESTAHQDIEAESEDIATADADPDVTGAPKADPDEDAVTFAPSDVSPEQILAAAVRAYVEHAHHRIQRIEEDVRTGEIDSEQSEKDLNLITVPMDEAFQPARTDVRSAVGEARVRIRQAQSKRRDYRPEASGSEASDADDHAA